MVQEIIKKLKSIGIIKFEFISMGSIYTIAAFLGLSNGMYGTNYNYFLVLWPLVTLNIIICEIILWNNRKKYYRFMRIKIYLFLKYTLKSRFY